MKHQIAIAIGCLLLAASAAHAAEGPVKHIGVESEQKLGEAKLNLTMNVLNTDGSQKRSVRSTEDGQKLTVGERIELCFSTSSDGYVTLWSLGADGSDALIYPNALSKDNGHKAMEVSKDKKVCLGGPGDKFRFVIKAPTGKASVYMHWTPKAEDNLEPDMFPVIGKSSRATRGPNGPYASTTLEYVIAGTDSAASNSN